MSDGDVVLRLNAIDEKISAINWRGNWFSAFREYVHLTGERSAVWTELVQMTADAIDANAQRAVEGRSAEAA